MRPKTNLLLGSIFAFFAVALGAFAAHGLKNILSDYEIGVFQTGVTYQFMHAFALLATGLLGLHSPSGKDLNPCDTRSYCVAGIAFTFGVLVFSGSLYLLALSGLKWFGAITPIGGLSFLVGWIALVFYFRKL